MDIINTLAGFFASALAAMGVGGGGLLVIYLTEILKLEQKTAQGINLVFFICASVSALAVHLRARKISFRAAIPFAVGGALGAVIGCRAALAVSNVILRKCFGALLLFAGGSTLWKEYAVGSLSKMKGGSKREKDGG